MINDVKIEAIERYPEMFLIVIRGALDTRLAFQLRDQIEDYITQGYKKYLVNFEELEYLSSAGVGVFSSLILTLQKEHGSIIFFNVPEQVHEILQITRLIEIFTIVDTAEQAFQALAPQESS